MLLEELRRHYYLELNISPCTTPPILNQDSTAIPEPTFTFCGTFSGKDNISAARWIKKSEFELGPHKVNSIIPAQRLLTSVDLLLTDKAAKWPETNPDAVQILASLEPTNADVTTFKNLFQERFSAEAVETLVASFDLKLSESHQRCNEVVTVSSHVTSSGFDAPASLPPPGLSHSINLGARPLHTALSHHSRKCRF